MKRAASQREDLPAASSEERGETKEEVNERKRKDARTARLLVSTVKLNASLSKAATRRESNAAQVLGQLSEVGQRYVATLLAGKLTRQGVRCGGCSNLITGGAGLAVHSCMGKGGKLRQYELPAEVRRAALVRAVDGSGEARQRCVLCGEWAEQGEGGAPHSCNLQCITPVLYDCIGVTSLADRYNSCDLKSAAGAELQEQLRLLAELWHAAMPERLAVSMVALPPPGQQQGRQGAAVDGLQQPVVTSTMTYVAPSSSIARGCEGMRFVPGSTPDTACPRFMYHGAITARGMGKTPAAAASVMAREFRRWQQQLQEQKKDPAGGKAKQQQQQPPELADTKTQLALGRRQHACMRVDPLLFGGTAYKLNHSCAPNMESSQVWVQAWGEGGTPALVLQRPPGAGPLAMHTELCWSYGATCDTREEEMECRCGAPECSGLLVRWKGRADKA